MRGDASIVLLMAFIFFFIMVAVFYAGFSGKYPSDTVVGYRPGEDVCKIDDDCKNEEDGKRCIVIYPGDFKPFCGCLTNDDCDVGKVCSVNKCISI